jgi:hypothetical protein
LVTCWARAKALAAVTKTLKEVVAKKKAKVVAARKMEKEAAARKMAKLKIKKAKVAAVKVLAAVTKLTTARKMPKVAVVKVLAVVLSKNTTPG